MQTTCQPISTNIKTDKKQRAVFVLQLHDGKIIIGTATNPCKRIAAINSGLTPGIPKALQVNRVIGIKDVTDYRNQVTTFKAFEAKYGVGNVIAV